LSGPARWCWVSLAALAGACTAYPPTVTTGPLLGPAAGGAVVSVCYDSSDHGRREIEQIALQACPKPTAAVTPWRLDTLLNECPLFKKTRISFRCVPE
jgi:hypothetical protein